MPPLADLLSSTDVQAQVCASGALLNIIGPDLDQRPDGGQQRRGLGRLMSLVMAAAAVYDCVFERQPLLV